MTNEKIALLKRLREIAENIGGLGTKLWHPIDAKDAPEVSQIIIKLNLL